MVYRTAPSLPQLPRPEAVRWELSTMVASLLASLVYGAAAGQLGGALGLFLDVVSSAFSLLLYWHLGRPLTRGPRVFLALTVVPVFCILPWVLVVCGTFLLSVQFAAYAVLASLGFWARGWRLRSIGVALLVLPLVAWSRGELNGLLWTTQIRHLSARDVESVEVLAHLGAYRDFSAPGDVTAIVASLRDLKPYWSNHDHFCKRGNLAVTLQDGRDYRAVLLDSSREPDLIVRFDWSPGMNLRSASLRGVLAQRGVDVPSADAAAEPYGRCLRPD